MTNARGTPYSCTDGQFATVVSRLTLALPRALKVLRDRDSIDLKEVIHFTDEGERLSLALAEAIKMLYNGHAATVPELVFRSVAKCGLANRTYITLLEPSGQWTLMDVAAALLNVSRYSSGAAIPMLIRERGYPLWDSDVAELRRQKHTEHPDARWFYFQRDAALGIIARSFDPASSTEVTEIACDWHEVLDSKHRILVGNFDPAKGRIKSKD